MKLTKLTPMLRVPDLAAAVDFYRRMLGFEVVNQFDGWAALQRDGIEVMFATPNEHMPFGKPEFTGSLYFQVQDVDTLWNEVKSKTDVLYPIETFDYGMREFAILDNNGYCLQFGSEV